MVRSLVVLGTLIILVVGTALFGRVERNPLGSGFILAVHHLFIITLPPSLRHPSAAEANIHQRR